MCGEERKKTSSFNTNDDSGFSDGHESVICLEDSLVHDNSDIVIVEDDVFETIESAVDNIDTVNNIGTVDNIDTVVSYLIIICFRYYIS